MKAHLQFALSALCFIVYVLMCNVYQNEPGFTHGWRTAGVYWGAMMFLPCFRDFLARTSAQLFGKGK